MSENFSNPLPIPNHHSSSGGGDLEKAGPTPITPINTDHDQDNIVQPSIYQYSGPGRTGPFETTPGSLDRYTNHYGHHFGSESNQQYDSAYYRAHPELGPPGLTHPSQMQQLNNQPYRPTYQPMFPPPPSAVPQTHPRHRARLNRHLERPDFNLPDNFGESIRHDSPHTPHQPPPDPRPPSPYSLPTMGEILASAKPKRKVKESAAPKPQGKGDGPSRKVAGKPDKKKRKRAVKNDEIERNDSSDEDIPAKKKSGGRTKGASTYSQEECRSLVDLVAELTPIGQRGWEALLQQYNKWARKHGYPERKRRPLSSKFNDIMLKARTKPTGDAERQQLYSDALAAEDAINEKAAIGDMQDDILEVSSDDEEEEEVVEVKKEKKQKDDGTVLTKAYKTEPPLRPLTRKNQATALLTQISSSLDPGAQQRRIEDRNTSTFQLMMLQNLQGEVNEQRRRADQAEHELQRLRLELELNRHNYRHRYHPRCHHRDAYESDSDYDRSRSHQAHSKTHHNRHRDSHSTSPPSSRKRFRRRSRSHTPNPFSHNYTPRTPHRPVSRHYTPPYISRPDSSPDNSGRTSFAPSHNPIERPHEGPVVVSSSRVTLDSLAQVAANLPELGSKDMVSVRPDGGGYYNVALISPTKKITQQE